MSDISAPYILYISFSNGVCKDGTMKVTIIVRWDSYPTWKQAKDMGNFLMETIGGFDNAEIEVSQDKRRWTYDPKAYGKWRRIKYAKSKINQPA